MISKEEILHLATLARIELTDADTQGLQNDISNILDYVKQVEAVSTAGISRDGAKPVVRNVMRADIPFTTDSVMSGKREALTNAFPKKEAAPTGGFFNVVRKIIQKDE